MNKLVPLYLKHFLCQTAELSSIYYSRKENAKNLW
jgi:hypothetical protein